MSFKTEQEEFWAGDFGSEYVKRNQGANWIASNTALFSKALHKTSSIKSCVEFGSNIGLNLRALKILFLNSSSMLSRLTLMPLTNLLLSYQKKISFISRF